MIIRKKYSNVIKQLAGAFALLLTGFLLLTFRYPVANLTSAAGSVSGDANGDCRVDGIDFNVWLNHYNPTQTVSGGPSVGDFDTSGKVDGIDFVIWLSHYGQTCPTTTNTPTPTGTSNSTYDDLRITVDRYFLAHQGPNGNGGTGLDHTWDINELSSSQIAGSPDAQKLLAACPLPTQRAVYPKLAWEYGGSDHQWIHPEVSALVYCVYVPVKPSTSHWTYNTSTDRVTGDIYVLFPDQNPCKNRTGRDQVMACIGDPTNSEILVDTMSYHDGISVGYNLQNASTEVFLILPDGTKVQLLINI